MIKFFNKIIRNEKILKNTLRGRCTFAPNVAHPRTTAYIWFARALALPYFAPLRSAKHQIYANVRRNTAHFLEYDMIIFDNFYN